MRKRKVFQKREYLGVLIGVAITAFGLTWFLIPDGSPQGCERAGHCGLSLVPAFRLE